MIGELIHYAWAVDDRPKQGDEVLAQKKKFKTIDEYIKAFPEDVQRILEKIRQTIRKAAPEAEETISYQIPTFKLNGKGLIAFAGYKKHVGMYAVPADDEVLKELNPYKSGKASVRFPIDKPIPYDLVKKIVAFRIKEQARK